MMDALSFSYAECSARERLPWDPPEVTERGETGEVPPPPPSPAPPDATARPRVEPMDSRAFEAWLEGR